MVAIDIDRFVKRYGPVEVVHDISFDIKEGEFLVLVGPSGCGKSTILRMVAGLEEISGGELRMQGTRVNELSPKERQVAMVFQDYALYPHMTVAQNIGFSLDLAKVPKAEREAQVKRVADILQIGHLLERRPRELSGGQRQRVAIGRAMVRKPRLFLFDEPLSNLDAKLRAEMRGQIKRLHQTLKTTSMYVTHDQLEAMTLADRIICLLDGHIAQVGTPHDLFDRPANVFVAEFIGSPTMNILPATAGTENGRPILSLAGGGRVVLPEGTALPSLTNDGNVLAGIRPEHLTDLPIAGPAASIDGVIDMLEPLGSDILVTVKAGEAILTARCTDKGQFKPGQALTLNFEAARLHLFDSKTQKRLG
ncbi:MAG: sn-glycerol-3-phosphate ABC transporter ATP-binding protein UgpC [Hyphomicrobiales bacterium]|nr:MAG: sn-glycerol-3-phosphate ABC transporter ATP-binding protein UgpC [Hyphomicrobiales bacterium]